MLVAEFNTKGEIVKVRDIGETGLTARWVDNKRMNQPADDSPDRAVWEVAQPVYRPLHIVETPIDPATEKPAGKRYQLEADGTVSQISLVAPLTDEEKADYELKSAKLTRAAALPDRDEMIEFILDVLKIVLDRQLMTEVPGDPRTRVSISQEGYDRLKRIRRALKATPLPNKIDVEKRTGAVTPDTKPESQRDTELNIFADRVSKVMADKTLPAALKDAMGQLRKLLA